MNLCGPSRVIRRYFQLGTGILAIAATIGSSASEDTAPPAKSIAAQSASLHALTVSKKRSDRVAGHVSRMTLTASALESVAADSKLVAAGGNGKVLERSLGTVREYFTKRGRWSKGTRFELGFTESSHPHDGESFSLGAALLYDALTSNTSLDDTVCVTGKLKTDGSIGRVGGIQRKIDAAVKANFQTVIIPAMNSSAVADALFLDGPELLIRTQIIGVDHLKHARQIVISSRSSETKKALELYGRLAGVIAPKSGSPEELKKILNRKSVRAAINQVLSAIPNHLSAHFLKKIAQGQAPGTLSPQGSARALDRIWPKLMSTRAGSTDERKDAQRAAMARLNQLTPSLAPVTKKYADAIRHYADLSKEIESSDESTPSKRDHLRHAGSNIDTERRYLQQELERRKKAQ